MSDGGQHRFPRRRLGVGRDIAGVPKAVTKKFEDFRVGYVAAAVSELVPQGGSPFMQDFLVDDQGNLVRAPGIVLNENLAPHDPKAIFAHADLDDQTELVFFDPPYMGFKTTGPTTWLDVGLPAGDSWVAVNHGGYLIFTNGRTSVYAREAGGVIAQNLSWGPGRALSSFAGRVFLGGATIGGVDNPMGIAWTGASGLHDDVDGLGSGYELLINDMSQGDRVVAMRAMNFDTMLVLCRKSLWIARRTGDLYRPAYFSSQFGSIGAVVEASVRNTQHGVVFLSDEGVKLVVGDGELQHLSAAIDYELLPVEYTQLNRYGGVYSQLNDTYELFTPDGIWIYSFRYNRWLKTTAKVHSAVALFNPATIDLSSLPAGWGLYWDGAWSESITDVLGSGTGLPTAGFMPQSWTGGFWGDWWGLLGQIANAILSDIVYLVDTVVGVTDPSRGSYLGVEQDPTWTSPNTDVDELDRLFTLKKIMIEYDGEGTLAFQVQTGRLWKTIMTKTLSDAAEAQIKEFKVNTTAKGLNLRIKLVDGTVRIHRIAVNGIPRGEDSIL